MILNRNQVAEKLGISTGAVLNLVKSGKITDLRADVKGRHVMQFNSKEINSLGKDNTIKPKRIKKNVIKDEPQTESKIPNILSRIEAKLDKLISMWS